MGLGLFIEHVVSVTSLISIQTRDLKPVTGGHYIGKCVINLTFRGPRPHFWGAAIPVMI